ncbi:MAG: S24/S26 family peptidase [Alistipes sp.]|nr:S24/S26 family peptidase [Alistipes sp.]
MSNARTIANRELFSIVRDTLLEGSTVRIAVNGQSMLPFFRSGSTITLRPIEEGDIRKYNVVMADAGESFVVHRIIEVGEEEVTLLGDGNYLGTERVARDKIYGIVDCSALHIFFAKIWLWMRPVRRFPLAIFRRIL